MKRKNGKYLDIDLTMLKIRLEAVSDFSSMNYHPDDVVFTCENRGGWGACLKSTGYEAIVIRGSSDVPVYLYVAKDMVSIKNAKGLWELDLSQTSRMLKQVEGRNIEAECIGSPDELCITGFSKSDTGALMRAKNIKAVVVKDSQKRKRYPRESSFSDKHCRILAV
jgi:aldehyde:ferredoxin oxidoreductase